MKVNYVSIYLNVSAYTYTGDAQLDVSMAGTSGRFSGKINWPVPNMGPILGFDKFRFVWNLDNIINEETTNEDAIEASFHQKIVTINKSRYCTFFFVYLKMIVDLLDVIMLEPLIKTKI